MNYLSVEEDKASLTPAELPPKSQKYNDNFLSWNTPLVHI